jgi:hypothetical protein
VAIDTRNKRASALGIALPGRAVFPNPDGSLGNQADRQHIAYGYPGILAGAFTDLYTVISNDLTTLFANYVEGLYAAGPDDLTTLVANDLPTVRAAVSAAVRRDANTMYFRYLYD